ncbi:hypothetical protein R3P38DRAFT_3576787 [Favolaschia claudopus]|uniref:Uncharacterized protein n=1 Tax=Favolaschia claudopus TaxID=2862362 RepID=A0AAW0DNT4_9AGAR
MTLPITLAADATARLSEVIVILTKAGESMAQDDSDELHKILKTYAKEANRLGTNVKMIYDAQKAGHGVFDVAVLTEATDCEETIAEFLKHVWSVEEKSLRAIWRLAGVEPPLKLGLRGSPLIPINPDARTKSEEAQDSKAHQSNPLENSSQPSTSSLPTQAIVTAVEFDALPGNEDEADSSDPSIVSVSEISDDQLAEALTEAVEDLRQSGVEEKTYEPSLTSDGGWSLLGNDSSVSVAKSSTVKSDEAGTSTGQSRGSPFKFKLRRLPDIAAIFGTAGIVPHINFGGGTGGQGGAGGLVGGGGGNGMAPQTNIGNTTGINFNCQGRK